MHYFYESILSSRAKTLLKDFTPHVDLSLMEGTPPYRPSLGVRRAMVLAFLRHTLMETFHFPLEQALRVFLQHYPSGQPYLVYPPELPQTALQISISHTSHFIGFALSQSAPAIGFDLEDMSKKRNIKDLSTSILSPLEQKYVQKYGDKGFYFLWGAKEALAKLKGQGLSFALSLNCAGQLEPVGPDVKSAVSIGGETFQIRHKIKGDLLITTAQEQPYGT